MPVAYADPDTHEIMMGPGEEEYYEEEVQAPPEPKEKAGEKEKETTVHRPTWLGFQPPPGGKQIPGVRARKSRGKKAMMGTMGADG